MNLDYRCSSENSLLRSYFVEFIQYDVTTLLKRGFTTTSAGGFFFIPYLLQLSAHDLLSSMNSIISMVLQFLFLPKTAELIHREFIDGVQGRVQLRGNVTMVNIYGFEHQAAAASILTNLEGKLSRAKIDPRIPWLGNRRLQFVFH